MPKKFRTKTKGKGRGKRYPVGGRDSTSLNFGRDKGSKSDTDLTSGSILFEDAKEVKSTNGLKGDTSLDFGQDSGTKSRTDLTSTNPLFQDGNEPPEKILESDTAIDPLRGDTSLPFGGKGKKPEDKEKFQVAPADDWSIDPDTGKKGEE